MSVKHKQTFFFSPGNILIAVLDIITYISVLDANSA